MREADELIDRIVKSSQVLSGKKRGEIQRELRAHIEDFVLRAREAGRNEAEIEKLALANFGDPGQIACGFAWVYRHERRTLRAFAYAASTVLLATGLLAVILAFQTGLAFSIGRPIVRVFTSWHTVIEALDILASVAVYLGLASLERLFERQKFQKAVLLLALIFSILIPCSAAAGLRTSFLWYGLVNGVFFRAVQLFVTRKAARIGIVAVCFPLVGVVLGLLRWPVSHVEALATLGSWLAMGAGYQVMAHLALRVDAALLNNFARVQERF